MPFDIGGIGQQAINTGFGLLLEKHNDKRQIKQQEKLQNLQIAGNKEMIDYQKLKDYEMWEKTNYKEQVKQLEKAGLNAALLYGMSGGGGVTTGGSGGGVSGGTAPTGGGEVLGASGMGIQLGMMKAQKDLIEAQTEKTKAETVKTAGVDTKEAETRIEQMGQGIENAKAAKQLMEVQTKIAQYEEQYSSESLQDRLAIAQWQWKKTVEEVRKIAIDTNLTEATTESQIEIARQQTLAAALGNKLLAQELINNDRIQTREDLKFQLTDWVEKKKMALEISDRTVDNIWKILERVIPGKRR